MGMELKLGKQGVEDIREEIVGPPDLKVWMRVKDY